MKLVKVTARLMNSGGQEIVARIPAQKLEINADMIGGVQGKKVLLKGGDKANIGGKIYTDFRLDETDTDYFK